MLKQGLWLRRLSTDTNKNKTQLKQVVIGMLDMDGYWSLTNYEIAMIL